MPPQQKKEERPQEILRAFNFRHPGIWEFFARCRGDRDWPDWCYVPVGAGQVYLAHEAGLPDVDMSIARALMDAPTPELMMWSHDAGIAATLAAWRMGRGIYRFDADFARALTATPLAGEIPVDVLYYLPEWAVYVEMDVPPVRGFFASLEWDARRAEAEMRLHFDTGDPAPTLLPLPLTASTMTEMLERLWERVRANHETLGMDAGCAAEIIAGYTSDPVLGRVLTDALPAALNLLIYLCSPEAEYRGGIRPTRPAAISTRRGERLFPAPNPRVWRIGETIGARLRQARTTAPNLPDERNAPRPHLRRAHWHTYRTGPGRQNYIVRWLHPILVGYGDDDSAV